MAMNESRPPQGAQAALRAVRLLKLFTSERPEMTLSEISQVSGLNKTTTHRLLRALQSEGLVDRNSATACYCLGTGLMALGVLALSSNDLRRRVRPLLRKLARESGETVTLEVPVERDMLILDEVAGRHVIAATGNIGTRWPLHATSTGKAYMAFDEHGIERLGNSLPSLTQNTLVRPDSFRPQLEDIRRRGYAETVDELEDGYTAVGTVIRSSFGDVLGALSIGGPTARMHASRRAQLGTTLCQTVARLDQRL